MTTSPVAYQLVSLTQSLRQCSEPAQEDAIHAQLNELVDRLLYEEREDEIREALALAEDEDTFCNLNERVEWVAEHTTILEEDGSTTLQSLFVVPVVALSQGLPSAPRDYLKGPAFQSFLESFRTQGLLPDDASMVVSPYLYHPDELSKLGFCTVSDLNDAVHAAVVEGCEVPADALAQTGWPLERDASPGQMVCELRFILGTVVSGDEASALSLSQPTEATDGAHDAFIERGHQWTRAAQPHVAQMLGLATTEVLVVLPLGFFGGFRQGLVALYTLMLFSQATGALEERGLSPRAVRAVIAPFGANGRVDEYRVSLLSLLDGTLVAGLTQRAIGIISEQDTVAFVRQALLDVGIEQVQTLYQLQQGEGTFIAAPTADAPPGGGRLQ
ncbi:DUF2863 family protein [Paraburkholderia sp. UCT31]|uniref:DUF2863 family protein n=1 Tax=Paraburkholderia sp. UCT31 TaxID=2615209 RepID=UPI0016551156|nr:DUF2863 family protein [Paraburkholderia sp. UCT31]MBC8739790.1 DUF2863 family protein [Paraburkholderia sp. UCT31]